LHIIVALYALNGAFVRDVARFNLTDKFIKEALVALSEAANQNLSNSKRICSRELIIPE
jgi:hypothetical protein